MVEQYVAPVDHSTGSAVGTTAAGAASGAVEGGFKGLLKGIKTLAIIGGVIGLGIALFGSGGLLAAALPAGEIAAASMPVWVGQIGSVLGTTAIGTALGGAVGVAAGWITVPVGGILGGLKGGKHAAIKVNEERGAAAAVQAQIDMIKAQNPSVAGTTIYAPSATNDNSLHNKYAAALPQQGAPMNAALPQIQGSALQYEGVAAGQQLAATR